MTRGIAFMILLVLACVATGAPVPPSTAGAPRAPVSGPENPGPPTSTPGSEPRIEILTIEL
jgi:hypothetical protein